MKAGNINGYDIKHEVWCDRCAARGAARGDFIVTENATPQQCQNQHCSDPGAELQQSKKK
jgi:hypothetical protein